jgi:rhodanese-related sulfurtransferase
VARELKQAGWPHSYALEGGWSAWQVEGMPVEAKAG